MFYMEVYYGEGVFEIEVLTSDDQDFNGLVQFLTH